MITRFLDKVKNLSDKAFSLLKPRIKTKLAYTLVELSISLSLIAVLTTIGINTIASQSNKTKQEITRKNMAVIETAIMDYYVLHKHLPCPAEGRALEMDSNFGFSEAYDAITHECSDKLIGNTGMVPVRTLKIPEEYAYDGWGRKFSYRIAKGMGNKDDFSNTFFSGDLEITNLSGEIISSRKNSDGESFGGVYVLISHGSAGGPYAWKKNNNTNPSPNLAERANIQYQNADHTVNKQYIKAATTNHFDDIVNYKNKLDFLYTQSAGTAPFAFEKQTCSNANHIASINVPTTANIDASLASHIPKAAAAIAKLCKNPPNKCDFDPKASLPSAGIQTWFKADDYGDSTNITNHARAGNDGYSYNGRIFQDSIPLFAKPILKSQQLNYKNIHFQDELPNYTIFFAGVLEYNDEIIRSTSGTSYNPSSGTCNKFNGAIHLKYGNHYGVGFNILMLSHHNYDVGIYIDPIDIVGIPVIIVARYCERTYCPNYSVGNNNGFSLYFYNKNGLILSNHRDASIHIQDRDLPYNFSSRRNTCSNRHMLFKTNTGLGEYIAYNTALDDKDISKVVEYLSNRWFTNVCP